MSGHFKRHPILNSPHELESAPEVVSAASAYIIFAAMSGLFVSLWFSPNESVVTILMATFLGVMFTVRFWTVGLLFLMVQTGLFLAESGSLDGFSSSPGSSLVAIGVLALLLSSCRYLTLTSSPMSYRLTNRSSIRLAIQHIRRPLRESFAPFGVLPRDDSAVGSAELITALVRLVVPAATVSVLLTLHPLDPGTPGYAGLYPPVVRTITLGIILLLICMLVNGLMSVFSWKRLSPAESRMFLRSELSKWIHREVSAVSRRRIRSRASRRH